MNAKSIVLIVIASVAAIVAVVVALTVGSAGAVVAVLAGAIVAMLAVWMVWPSAAQQPAPQQAPVVPPPAPAPVVPAHRHTCVIVATSIAVLALLGTAFGFWYTDVYHPDTEIRQAAAAKEAKLLEVP